MVGVVCFPPPLPLANRGGANKQCVTGVRWNNNCAEVGDNLRNNLIETDPKWTRSGPETDPKWTRGGPETDPMYATVRRRRRSPPDGESSPTKPEVPLNLPVPNNRGHYNGEMSADLKAQLTNRRVTTLEERYGERAEWAATVIQRAFRTRRLRSQFSRLMVLAQSTDRLDRRLSLFGDEVSPSETRRRGDEAVLSPSEKVIRLRRSASVRERKNKKSCCCQCQCTKDDLAINEAQRQVNNPSEIPPPCPPLRGEGFYEPIYGRHKSSVYVPPPPPQRTVSFLVNDTFPRKVAQIQEPIYVKKTHNSDSNLLYGQIRKPSPAHNRSVSSPAPLSPPTPRILTTPLPPPPPLTIPEYRSDSPLPPPPYISPPAQRDESPLPPPPPVEPLPLEPLETRESSSSASSIDSGFRSSLSEHPESPTRFQSPHFIASPDSLLREAVFEPRPLRHHLHSHARQTSFTCPPRNARLLDTSADTSYSDLYGRISKAPSMGTPVNYSSQVQPKVKKTVRIQTPTNSIQTIQHPDDIDDVSRRRQYRVGLNLFNQNPERGMEYLLKKNFIEYSPASVAKFLLRRKGLSKKVLGEYLTNLQRPFNLAILHCFVHDLDFSGLHLDIALRQLQEEVTFPGESQKIEKLVEVFSKRYIQCNQMFVAGFNSPDTIFVLSYAMVLLNTDLHTRALRPNRRMQREDFLRNLRGVDAGADLDAEMLRGIYDRIRAHEFRPGSDHVSQVARVEETITGRGRNAPRLNEPHRRLVCFCRVTEVPDMARREKSGAHQRGIFLFNDLLVVTKSLAKKKSVHQFRHKVFLRDLRVNVFSTVHYPYGVQLQDRITGKISATFNTRSDHDQQRFVTDLQEAVAETAEMDRARMVLNEEETMC